MTPPVTAGTPETARAPQTNSETAKPKVLLVATPLPGALRLRLLSYLDPATSTLRVDPNTPSDPTFWPEYAATHGAVAVVSFTTQPDGTLLITLSPALPGAASLRKVPLTASPTALERSAAYESAALIATSMLDELLGSASSTPPSSTPPSSTPPSSTPPSPTLANAAAEPAQPETRQPHPAHLRFRLAGGYGFFLNPGAQRHGPKLEVGSRYGALSTSLAVSLLNSQAFELPSAGTGQVRISTREWLLAAPVRWHIPISESLGAGLGIAPAVSWVKRSSQSIAPGVAETPETGLLTAQIDGFASFYWKGRSPNLSIGVDLGVAGLISRPRWTVRDEQDRTVAHQQWASLQPSSGVWFAWLP